MATTIGVIGTGNMGAALVKGWLRANDPELRILVWDKREEVARQLLTCETVTMPPSLEWLVKESDPLLIVVKPGDAASLLRTLAPLLRPGQKLISSMAGLELSELRSLVGPAPRLFRIMPNLGVALGAGVVAVSDEPGGPAADLQTVIDLLSRLGPTLPVPEDLFDAVTAVAGTGPALLAIAVEALEDGAVAAGLSRALARRLVRRVALGTAGLLEGFDDSAERLRAAVAARSQESAAVLAGLEERGFLAAYRAAVTAAVERGAGLRAQVGGWAAPCTLEQEGARRSEEG